jgi:hypothetical protein
MPKNHIAASSLDTFEYVSYAVRYAHFMALPRLLHGFCAIVCPV